MLIKKSVSLVLVAVGLISILLFTPGCTRKAATSDNSLNVVLIANVKGLDPISSNDLYSSTVIQNIYEGLYEYHYLKRPYTLQPQIAESMPVVTDNGLTVTIKLKQGVRFHDNPCFADGKGREVTADDFIYSFRRLADPKNMSDGFWIFDGKVKGLNAWAEALKAGKADYKTPIEGLQAPDKYTLVIKLVQPYYQLNQVLAMGFASVVPHEAVEKYGAEFLNNPVGTGPFMLEKSSDWIRGSKITLKKNPNWRVENYPSEGEPADQEAGLLADSGKRLPFVDTLVFTETVEDQPRWQNFAKGNTDFVSIPNDNFDSVVKSGKVVPEYSAKGIKIGITDAVEITYVGMNMKDSVLGKNKELRHALSLALDTPAEIEKFHNGQGLQAQSPIPPGIEGYDPQFKNPWVQYDLAKAKEALAKAGFPEGKGLPELTLSALADSKSRQQAEFMVSEWAKIGVKVKISASTWPQFLEKVKHGEHQLFAFAWGADYPDAQNFLQLYYSKNVSPGPNDTNFSSAEFDRLYEKALTLPPGSERTELYKKMRDIVVEETPAAFSMTRKMFRAYHGWLNNFKFNEIGLGIYKYMRVDTKKRAELKAAL
jgi:oligopeptide transport system substrate-binding protein